MAYAGGRGARTGGGGAIQGGVSRERGGCRGLVVDRMTEAFRSFRGVGQRIVIPCK